MRTFILLCATLLTLTPCAEAQQPAGDDVLSTYLRRAYAAVSRDVVAAVELMPEEQLGFRPAGVIDKVRTFGQIAAHIVEANHWVCSAGDGKPKTPSIDGGLAADKSRLVAALKEVDARCTAYLESVTDAALREVLTTGPADRQLQAVRGNAIIFAIAHSNEHYGNLVTYLRAHGLVPPATASQASFLAPVRQP
jgi:uncharacterized damage-inducible protein DinB